MLRKFRPHQRVAFRYTFRTRHPALFMDMRLGKTLVTIRTVKLYKPQGEQLRVLVVAPNSALGSWKNELSLEGTLDFIALKGTREKRLQLLHSRNCSWFLINREGHLSVPEIADVKWDAVILDESTFIANPQSKVTRFFTENFREVPHRWVLTGTPNPESDMQFFSQMRWLDSEFLGCQTFWQFRAKYYHPDGYTGFGWVPNKGVHTLLRSSIRSRALLMKRKDVGFADQKIYEVRRIEMPVKIERSYRKLEKEFVLEIGAIRRETKWKMRQYSMLRRMCGGFIDDQTQVWAGKYLELESLLLGELKNEQVVVWFSFNAELHHAVASLLAKGVTAGGLTGANTTEERELNRKRFHQKKIRVLCIQQAIAQMGIDLSCADTAIYFSEPVSHLARKQTEDRIVSLAKDTPLLYVFLLCANSVDEDIHDALALKSLTSDMHLKENLMRNMLERNG